MSGDVEYVSLQEFFNLAGKQRNKAISTILNAKDSLDEYLEEEDAEFLRKVILDEINFYHNFVIDLVVGVVKWKSDSIINVKYLEMIEDLYRNMVNNGD